MPSIELKLSRFNRIYQPSDLLEGKIVIKSSSSISHYGIVLTLNGSVNLQVRGGSAGVIESFYGVVKPIPIVKKNVEIRTSGKIGPGTTEIPFSINLRQRGEENLERFYETFHGRNISIQVRLFDLTQVKNFPLDPCSETVLGGSSLFPISCPINILPNIDD
ncbi:hypothetical protein Pint_17081 [Pistacia integerrima]|uniref:Uncharacterized protein n=1 Tax=Pistacia integerrima TaxID=434235 RepID=A0ACC0ZAT8_9ROSI|nr:hypothetical protein Pint_17081 [Pistacia integerrima]